jgi:hypothetical protein
MLAGLRNAVPAEGTRQMEFFLQLMRMLHAVLGITPAEPKEERTYLWLWVGAFALIFVVVMAFVVLFAPRIMH